MKLLVQGPNLFQTFLYVMIGHKLYNEETRVSVVFVFG